MPHIIIEYCAAKSSSPNETDLMKSAHRAAVSTDLFDENAIKVRARQFDNVLIGGMPDSFAHVTIYLIDGRDKPTKKRLAQMMLSSLEEFFPDYASISVDVRDLDKAVYTKIQRRGQYNLGEGSKHENYFQSG